MAGNWIKADSVTPDKPEVARLADILHMDDPDLVLGKLWRFWVWVDANSRDGVLNTKFAHIDRIVYCPGFARALVSVGWLSGREGRLVIPNFDRHSGNSAKARALEAEAKRIRRSLGSTSDGESDTTPDESPTQCPKVVRHNIQNNVRPEKIREERDKIGDIPGACVEQFPESAEEVELFMRAQTVRPPGDAVQECAQAFFDTFSARGWRDTKGVPLADWRPAARSYARTWARNAVTNPQPQPTKKKDDYRL